MDRMIKKLALFLALAAVSCSSNSVKPGNPNDEQFLATKSFVDAFLVPTVVGNMATGAANQDGFTPPADSGFALSFPRVSPRGNFSRHPLSEFISILKRPTGPSGVDSGYAGGWHYFLFDSTGTAHLTDSVQFRNTGGAQQFPDTTTNRFEIRFLLQAAIQHGLDSLRGQVYFNHVFQRSGNTVTVNGTEKDSLILALNDSSDLRITAKLNQTFTGVTFQTLSSDTTGFDDCPDAGSVRLVGSIGATGSDVPDGELSVNFDITLTFGSGGSVQVVVVDNGRKLRWTYTLTGICNGPA